MKYCKVSASSAEDKALSLTASAEADDKKAGLSKNFQHHQNQIECQSDETNIKWTKLKKPEVESQQLKEMLNPQNFTKALTQSVSCLQIKQQGEPNQ